MPAALLLHGLRLALRLVTAAALAVDAYVHADLAMRYDLNRDAAISQGDLFRIEAGLAAFAALVLVLFGTRISWLLALLVAGSAFAAVMLYARYDLGVIGPIPDMYEPAWYSEKTHTAIAEAIATGTALVGLVTAPGWYRPETRRPMLHHRLTANWLPRRRVRPRSAVRDRAQRPLV